MTLPSPVRLGLSLLAACPSQAGSGLTALGSHKPAIVDAIMRAQVEA